MGCGCGRNRAVNSGTVYKNVAHVCEKMRDELLDLDVKAGRLHTEGKGDIDAIAEARGKIRLWVAELVARCPDDYDYSFIKQYITNVYTEHYK